ncbi:regulatory protein, luxR family [Nakamurella panacisegetis]|uniref:Regulatory protein, luxR family n=1 Tax=Nakamurella panacisegetis TaxID=1090615 RepID=A0A1H0LKJ9_9ACTN|nr:helix-turn-helix transcriptional regulator [Nakamurella panacisegetis]SDO68615.1 regulatory protein, luxR family [Nakamurella panacisegetis]
MRDLEQALNRDDWEAVDTLLDQRFFRYLYTNSELLERVFDSAGDQWFSDHPRQVLRRAVVDAVRRPGALLDERAQAEFDTWVRSQADPALRDILGIRRARLAELVSHGWHQDAADVVDQILEDLKVWPGQSEGLRDIMPGLMVSCGTAKLLAGDSDAAATCFFEAVRWSSYERGHPFAPFARGHLALVHVLSERYADAAQLLEGVDQARSEPGTVAYASEGAGLLAQLLVHIASLDTGAVHRLLGRIDQAIIDGEWGWIALHARAWAAILDDQPWDLIHEINAVLVTTSLRTSPDTMAGACLRADLVALYQAAGDLRAADQVLATPKLPPTRSVVVLARARQALLRGRPDHALALFRQEETARGNLTPTRYGPTGAVLYAAAEIASAGQVSPSALQFAASTVAYHRAFIAAANASPALRELLLPLLDDAVPDVPAPWEHRTAVKLTRREREVLSALRRHGGVAQVAAALHISPNTAKTHIRALYRKLGAHNREEALWIATR